MGLLILIAIALSSCGSQERHGHEIIIEGGDTPGGGGSTNEFTFTDKSMEKSCFNSSCHNKSAPDIVGIRDGFKTDKKVKARIANGSMPPGGKWDKSKIDAALRYLNSK